MSIMALRVAAAIELATTTFMSQAPPHGGGHAGLALIVAFVALELHAAWHLLVKRRRRSNPSAAALSLQ